jgi:ribosome-associated heat shock protein Hsp15
VTNSDADSSARLDRWLWAVRLFKTRPLATAACRGGGVTIQDQPAKPARHVHLGEIVTVRQGIITRTLVVRGVPASRVGAKLVAGFCEEQTPAGEWAKLREQRRQHVLAREKGSGRPTKRERRMVDRLFE